MQSKCLNLFSGPSCGKSTIAAHLFSYLKRQGKSAELVHERAKELVYENRLKGYNQAKLFGDQLYRIERLQGKVEYIIVDSPLLLSVIYQNTYKSSFNIAVADIFLSMNNINFFIQRCTTINFEEGGRIHSLEESIKIDKDILDLLNRCEIPYYVIRNKINVNSVVHQIGKYL